MEKKYRYPCRTCTRVADPKQCENKRCLPWRNWFVRQWEMTRQGFIGENR
ncbi:MAG: hypothetical protein IKW10_06080 [Oscillospiraceae bacterium]|nr:hypothetical protein [Oscillospiraceae bacterium]